MSAGDRDTLAAIIAEHDWPLFSRECRCGEPTFGSEGHRAHVADVIASSDWLREQRAEAWEQGMRVDKPRCDHLACRGRNQCVTGSPLSLPINPYRTTEDTDAH